MNKIIYYFSGTGNSLRTARIIAKEIGGAKLISMSNVPSSVPANDAKIIGFVCPVYEWDIPEPVKFFVKNLTLNPQAYIFMVSTYIAIHGRCFETMDCIAFVGNTMYTFFPYCSNSLIVLIAFYTPCFVFPKRAQKTNPSLPMGS